MKCTKEYLNTLEDKVICFDIDGVVTDHTQLNELINRYVPNFDYDKHMTEYEVYDSLLKHGYLEGMTEKEIKKIKQDIKTMFKIMIEFFDLTKGFKEYYDSVTKNNTVHFISARKENDIEKTIEYFKNHYIEIDSEFITHTGSSEGKFEYFDKYEIDVLFEDKLSTVTKFLETYPDKMVCLINTPYNKNEIKNVKLHKINNFQDLIS